MLSIINNEILDSVEDKSSRKIQPKDPPSKRYNWTSGQILEDRKSTFQAHLVQISSKNDVSHFLRLLILSLSGSGSPGATQRE
jgi:hypothetical protein